MSTMIIVKGCTIVTRNGESIRGFSADAGGFECFGTTKRQAITRLVMALADISSVDQQYSNGEFRPIDFELPAVAWDDRATLFTRKK